MLLMTATEDHLKRGSIMAVAERFNMARSMIHRLWKCVEHMHATGVINSPKLLSQKNILGECLSICQSSLRRCQECTAEEEAYSAKAGEVNGGVQNNSALLDCCINPLCAF